MREATSEAAPRKGAQGPHMHDGAGTRGAIPDELLAAGAISEAELTELALAADPGAPLDPDAVPMAVYLDEQPGLLPEWYMPAPTIRRARAWRIPVVVAIVAAFVIIEAVGLCSTFGPVVLG